MGARLIAPDVANELTLRLNKVPNINSCVSVSRLSADVSRSTLTVRTTVNNVDSEILGKDDLLLKEFKGAVSEVMLGIACEADPRISKGCDSAVTVSAGPVIVLATVVAPLHISIEQIRAKLKAS